MPLPGTWAAAAGYTLSPGNTKSGHGARVHRALVPMEEGGQEDIREGQTKMLSLLLRDQSRSMVCHVDTIIGYPRLKEHLYTARAGVNDGTLCRGECCWQGSAGPAGGT